MPLGRDDKGFLKEKKGFVRLSFERTDKGLDRYSNKKRVQESYTPYFEGRNKHQMLRRRQDVTTSHALFSLVKEKRV